jgi:DNA-binding NarL/FixJ family response regulator
MHQIATQEGSAAIAILDPLKLRRAMIVSFLGEWAEANASTLMPVDVESVCPDSHFAFCRMAILNLGGTAICSVEAARWTDRIRTATSQAPLVILSDNEDPVQVFAAIEAGAQGFIAASTEPVLALQALTFILSGGSFFPPSALNHVIRVTGKQIRVAERKRANLNARSGRLTRRQQQVLNLLRVGKSNKMIARDLQLQEATVKVHVRQIMRKMGVSNRIEVALQASVGSG